MRCLLGITLLFASQLSLAATSPWQALAAKNAQSHHYTLDSPDDTSIDPKACHLDFKLWIAADAWTYRLAIKRTDVGACLLDALVFDSVRRTTRHFDLYLAITCRSRWG